jgi:hypothetical protein
LKIRVVDYNNRKKAFEVQMGRRTYAYPYSRAGLEAEPGNLVRDVRIDPELAREGFTYTLESGDEGTVHGEQVLDYNQDPDYLHDILLYKLTVEAQNRLETTPLSRREIIRRLGTSATQFYRLIDQTNTRKSFRQLLALLHILDCDVELLVKGRRVV